MKGFEKLIVRAQVIKLGPDQILLAFAIAWIAKHALKLNTQLELVALEGADSSRMANYEGVLLQIDEKDFASSEVRECLRLREVASLLHGPLRDLALGAGTEVRQELLAEYDILMEHAGVLFRQGKTELCYMDPSVFLHQSMLFHRRLMGLIDDRLKTHSLAAWCA